MTGRIGGDEIEAAPPEAPRATIAVIARYLFPPILILVVAALTPTSQMFPDQGDVHLYLEKARAFVAGETPYRDFSFEYPPAALVPMVVPYAVWPFGAVDLDVYRILFAGWEAALLLILGLILVRTVRLGGDAEAATVASGNERVRRTGTRLAVLALGAALALAWRFDLYPALLMMIALWAALDGRPGAAGVVLALGFLAKLFPVAILPALAVPWLVPFRPWALARLAVGFGLTAAAGFLPFVLRAWIDATFQFLRYNAERGLHVETFGGALALLGGLVTGSPVEMNFRFSSVNVMGAFAETWLALLPVATIVGFGAIAWLGWRRIRAEGSALGRVRPATVVALATLCVLMLIATSKVYSIQYVVWFVPLVALLGGRKFWLAAAVVALTMPIHPLLYQGIVNQEALPILVLNLRNALLVALLGWMLWELARPAGLEPTTFRSAT